MVKARQLESSRCGRILQASFDGDSVRRPMGLISFSDNGIWNWNGRVLNIFIYIIFVISFLKIWMNEKEQINLFKYAFSFVYQFKTINERVYILFGSTTKISKQLSVCDFNAFEITLVDNEYTSLALACIIVNAATLSHFQLCFVLLLFYSL